MSTRFQFVDDSGETRLAGFLVPEPGGSTPGAAIVARYDVAFDTAGISAGGVTLFTPAVDDVILDATVIVSTAWNGTTPQLDIGIVEAGDSHFGIFGHLYNMLDVTQGVTGPINAIDSGGANVSTAAPPTDLVQAIAWANAQVTPAAGTQPVTLGYFTAALPFKAWVTQDGKNNGADPGASQGAARIYIQTATPA